MLSVGIYTYSTQPRGSVVHAMSLAEALVREGHDATLYALEKPGASLYRPLACPVELIPAAAAPADLDALIRQRIEEFVRGVRRIARRHDVFHAQDCLAANALLAARTSDQGPIVRTVHHVDHFESSYLTECQRRSVCNADAVFSVSRLTQKNVLDQFGRCSRLVHNGADRERFAVPRPDVEHRLRTRFGVERGDTLVLSVGGVEPRKNTLLALKAVAAAYTAAPRLRWIIAGDQSIWDHSAYVASFEGELARVPQRLRDRVRRAGTLSEDEMTSLYCMSDVLFCPSREEGFGLCVLEAMAAGTAVVVPGRAPFTEYLDARCAAFIGSDAVEAMTAELVSVLSDVRRRARLAAAAMRRLQRFTWSQSARRHLHHYATIRSTLTRSHGPGAARSIHA
jgi:glycosyltransferase-like protein